MKIAETKQSTNTVSKNETANQSLFFQPKLAINQPNDLYEQEADAMAEKVVTETPPEKKFFAPAFIQRRCASCEDDKTEKQLQKKEMKKIEGVIQRQDDEEQENSSPTSHLPLFRPRQGPFLVPPLHLDPPFSSIDYLSLHETFFNRGVMFPGNYMEDAEKEWARQYLFYRGLGLGNVIDKTFLGRALRTFGVKPPGGDWNAWLSNTTTPLSVDSALSRDFPNENELEERRGGLPAPTIFHLPEVHFKKADEDENDNREVSSETEKYLTTLSGGEHLPVKEEHYFGTRLASDFSDVKIHTDSAANESAKNLNALAFTKGNDIVFASGQYQPETPNGKKLLAHELTHVIQQNGTIQRKTTPADSIEEDLKAKLQTGNYASAYLQLNDFLDWSGIAEKKAWLANHPEVRYMFLRSLPGTVVAEVYSSDELVLKSKEEAFAIIDCWYQTEADKQILYAQNLSLFDHLIQTISPYTGENITTVVSRLTNIIPAKSYANYAENPEFHIISLLAPTIDRKIKFYAQYDGLFKVVSKKFDPFTGTSKEVFEYLTDSDNVDKERAVAMYETLKKLPEEQRNAFLETAAFAGMLEADKDAEKFYSNKYKAQYKALPHNWDSAIAPWHWGRWDAPFAERLTVDHAALMSSMLTYEYKSTRAFGFDVGIDSSLDKDKGQTQSDSVRLIIQMNDENNFNDPDRLRLLLAIAVRGGDALRNDVIQQVLIPKRNAKAISAETLKVIESFGFIAANQFKYEADKPIARDHNDRLILYAIETLFKGSTKILGEQRVTVDLLKIQESKYGLGSLGGLRLAKSGSGDDFYNTKWLAEKANLPGSDTSKKNIEELKSDQRTGKLFVSVREDVRQANIYASSLPVEGLNYFSGGTLYRSGPGKLQGIAINISWAKDANEYDNKLDLVIGIENIEVSDFQMVAPKSTLAIGSIIMKGMRLRIDKTNLNDPKLVFGGARLTAEALGLIPDVLTLLPYAVMTMKEEFKGAKEHIYKDKLGILMQADFSSMQSSLTFTSLQVKNLYDTTAGFLDDLSIEKRDEQGRLVRQGLAIQETNLWTIDASKHIQTRIKTIDDKVRSEKAEIINVTLEPDDTEDRDLNKQIENLEIEKQKSLNDASSKALKHENRDKEMKRLREIYSELPALTEKFDKLFDKAKVNNPLYNPITFAALYAERQALQKDLDYLDNKYFEDTKTAAGDKSGIERFEARQRKAEFEAKYKSVDVTIKLRGINIKGGNYLRDMLNNMLNSMGFEDPTLKGLENIEIGAVDSAFVASGKGVTSQTQKPGVSVSDIHVPLITAPKLAFKTDSMLLEAGQPTLENVIVSVAINFSANPLDKGIGASYKWQLADLTVAKAAFNGLTVKTGKAEPLLDLPAATPVIAWGFHFWNYDPEKGNINLSINDVQAQGVYADSAEAAKTSKKIGFGIDTVTGHKPGENKTPAIEINYDKKDESLITKVNIPSAILPSLDIQSPTLSVSSLAAKTNAVEIKDVRADVKILLEKPSISGKEAGRPMSIEINNLHVGEIDAQGIKLIMREDPDKRKENAGLKADRQTVQEVTLPVNDKVSIKDLNIQGLRVSLGDEGPALSTLADDTSVNVGKTDLSGIGYSEKTAKGSVLKTIALNSGKFDSLSLSAIGRNGRSYSLKEFFKFFGSTKLEGLNAAGTYEKGKTKVTISLSGKKNIPISIDYTEPEGDTPGYYDMRLPLSRVSVPALQIEKDEHEIIIPKSDNAHVSFLKDVDVRLRAYINFEENKKVDYDIYLMSLDIAELDVFGLEYHNKTRGIDVVFDKLKALRIPNVKAGGFHFSSTKGFDVFGKAGGWLTAAGAEESITASFDSIHTRLTDGGFLAEKDGGRSALDLDIASLGFFQDEKGNMSIKLGAISGGFPKMTITQKDKVTGAATTTTIASADNKAVTAEGATVQLGADKNNIIDVAGLTAGGIKIENVETKGTEKSTTTVNLAANALGADSVNVKLNADKSKEITLTGIKGGQISADLVSEGGKAGKSVKNITLPDPKLIDVEAVVIKIDPDEHKKITIRKPTVRNFKLRMPSQEVKGDYTSVLCDLKIDGDVDLGDGSFKDMTVGAPFDAFVFAVDDDVPVQVSNLRFEYKDTSTKTETPDTEKPLTADQQELLRLEEIKNAAEEKLSHTNSTKGTYHGEPVENPEYEKAASAYFNAQKAYDAQKAKIIGAAEKQAQASMTKKYLDAVEGTAQAKIFIYDSVVMLNIETYKSDKYVEVSQKLVNDMKPVIRKIIASTVNAPFWKSAELISLAKHLQRWYISLFAPTVRGYINAMAKGYGIGSVLAVFDDADLFTGFDPDDASMFGINININSSAVANLFSKDIIQVMPLCKNKYKHPLKNDFYNLYGIIEYINYIKPALVSVSGKQEQDTLKKIISKEVKVDELGLKEGGLALKNYLIYSFDQQMKNIKASIISNLHGIDVTADLTIKPEEIINQFLKEKKAGSVNFDKGGKSIEDVHIEGVYVNDKGSKQTIGSIGAGKDGSGNIVIPGITYLSEDKGSKLSYNELDISPVNISYEADVLMVLNKSILLKGLKGAILKK